MGDIEDLKKFYEEKEDEETRQKYLNSSLDISDKYIEPRSQDIGYKTNSRDLQLANIGAATEFFIHRLCTLSGLLRDRYERRGIFPEGLYKRYVEQRDRILIISNSRDGFLRKSLREQSIKQTKITEDRVEPTKNMTVKKDFDANSQY